MREKDGKHNIFCLRKWKSSWAECGGEAIAVIAGIVLRKAVTVHCGGREGVQTLWLNLPTLPYHLIL